MILKQKKLLSVDECRDAVPLSAELELRRETLSTELKINFENCERFVVVCGPCSADSLAPMTEYLTRLKRIADECPDLLVVARIYTAKPHSNGQGFQGACFHERSGDAVDINSGLIRCRRIMVKCLELGLPIADEILYPELSRYFDDLVLYRFIGARSSEDTLHRAFASSQEICCGIKNGTDGDVEKLVDSVYAATHPSVFPFDGKQVETSGCKCAHVVLRGGRNDRGYFSNMTPPHVDKLYRLLSERGLPSFIMADLSHANSGKIAVNQIENARTAIRNPRINGVMMESYLYGGISQNEYGVSKADECLDINETERVLKMLQQEFHAGKQNN
ncbi:MAG: 3-deoxy-7-phosphoheptulonate synthase [Corallococcus sp.]|nr:3-deoxy-7-phosphoheptulonate synthase [Corallococcus sp.]